MTVELRLVKKLSADNPNLQLAANRLQRTLRIWALLFAGMGILLLGALRAEYPTASTLWFASALLILLSSQPAFLALVAIQWGISLTSLIPGVAQFTGPDPLSYLFDSGVLETLVLVGVRLVMIVTAVNQFLFYRMLYGTESIQALNPDLMPIPEVIPNRTGQIAIAGRFLGFLGILLTLLSIPMRSRDFDPHLLNLALGSSTMAMGFGLGVAFSPTQRRGTALMAIILGGFAFILAILIARIL
jgi:hypothetical protein